MTDKLYVHYGCGNTAPTSWVNFDAAPSLRIQKMPLLGRMMKMNLRSRGKAAFIFPENVMYGDIIKGLPKIKPDSCDGVYCSHVLEHLSLNDFHHALRNTYKILKRGGIFRLVVPDLEYYTRTYIRALDQGVQDASLTFMKSVFLGREQLPRKVREKVSNYLAFPYHLWMWDGASIKKELEEAGFTNIERKGYKETNDTAFYEVESEARVKNSVVMECIK